jgi:hypothetical protein
MAIDGGGAGHYNEKVDADGPAVARFRERLAMLRPGRRFFCQIPDCFREISVP